MVAPGHGPRSAGVAAALIDPVLVVPQHSMPSNGAGMTGNRVSALPLPKHASDLETTPGVSSPEQEVVTIA